MFTRADDRRVEGIVKAVDSEKRTLTLSTKAGFRNPRDARRPRDTRFAPEALERKLSPTGLPADLPPALYGPAVTADEPSGPQDPPPPPGDGDPPITDPTYPIGPLGPA